MAEAAATCALASSVVCRDTVSVSRESMSSSPDNFAASPGGVRDEAARATSVAELDGSTRPRSARSDRKGASDTYRIMVSPECRAMRRIHAAEPGSYSTDGACINTHGSSEATARAELGSSKFGVV